MKKLMIMLGALAIAMGVQAASVSWKVSGASDWKSGTVYAITGYSSADVIAYFESTTASDWAKAVDGAANNTITSRGAATGLSADVGSSIVFAFVSSDGIAAGNTWAVSTDVSTSGYTYTPPATKPGDLTFSYDAAKTGTFTAVPEPTSGLLLLLGMAGLALKRKRA